MRVVAALLTLIALTAAALAGQELWIEVKEPPQARAPVRAIDTAALHPAEVSQAPRAWPALFGEPQPPAPPAPPPQPPEPVVQLEPPRPPMPPIDSLGYRLTGLVRTDGAIWATISHPTGQRVLRAGDTLEDGLVIDHIDSAGIWVTDGYADPALLGFSPDVTQ